MRITASNGTLRARPIASSAPHSARFVDMWGHPDQTEGPLSFTEKRPADWLPLENR